MNQDFFCTYFDHEEEPISGFCLSTSCPNKSQWCVQCFTTKHQAHQNECKTFAQIKQLIKNYSSLICDWQKKIQAEYEKVSQLYKTVFKFLENEKIHQRYQQFSQEQTLTKWNRINLTLKDDLLSMLFQLKELSESNNEIQTPPPPPDRVSKVESNIINQGLDHKKSGKLMQALQCFETAIKQNSQNHQAWFQKGWVLDDLQRYSDALKCFDNSIRINPKYIYAFNNKGITLHKLKQYDEAIQCFNQSIKLDGSFPQAFNNKGFILSYLGFSLYSKNHYQEAIECYNQAINLDPKYAQAYFNKGLALQQMNRYDQAIKFYEQAIQIDPRFANAYFNKRD